MAAIAPGVYSSITDNSDYTPEGVLAGYFGLFPVFSNRGIDNKCKLISDLNNYETSYNPNVVRFGLTGLLARNWLKGGSSAYICRLLPDSATHAVYAMRFEDNTSTLPKNDASYVGVFNTSTSYADGNIVKVLDPVYAGYYINNTGGAIPAGEFDATVWTALDNEYSSYISYATGDYVVTFSGSLYRRNSATSGDFSALFDLIAFNPQFKDYVSMVDDSSNHSAEFSTDVMDTEFNTQVDTNSRKDLALMFYGIGRGIDYNKISISLSKNDSLTNTLDHTIYDLNVYDTDDNGATILAEGSMQVAFTKDAVDVSGESLYIEDVVEKYSKLIGVKFSYENALDFLIAVGSLTPDEAEATMKTDIFAKNQLLPATPLVNGSDGKLFDAVTGRIDPVVVDDLLVKFYSGLIDSDINNFKRVYAKLIASANFSDTVKNAMSSFVSNNRTDIFAYIDTGVNGSPESELAKRGGALSYSNRNVALQAGAFKIKEPYNGSLIRVPFLMNFIENISRVWSQQGIEVPVGGYDDRGTITGYIPDTYSYSINQSFQDIFYLNQLNPMIEDPTGIYCLSTLTSQKKYSALSNASIVNMVQVMDVELRLIAQTFLLRFITPDTLNKIKKVVNDYFLKWYQNNGIEKVNVSVISNELDKKNKRVRVNIEVYPTYFIEKIMLNFIIR